MPPMLVGTCVPAGLAGYAPGWAPAGTVSWMPPNPRKRRGLTPGIILVLIAAVLAVSLVARHGKPLLTGSGCQAGTGAAAISLDTEQAAIAATIVGVAHQRAMPPRAVVVAYAGWLPTGDIPLSRPEPTINRTPAITARVLFLVGADGRRPCFGWIDRLQKDPAWKDSLLFNEYFHGDNGAGIGASHQTGWTGLVAKLLQQSGVGC